MPQAWEQITHTKHRVRAHHRALYHRRIYRHVLHTWKISYILYFMYNLPKRLVNYCKQGAFLTITSRGMTMYQVHSFLGETDRSPTPKKNRDARILLPFSAPCLPTRFGHVGTYHTLSYKIVNHAAALPLSFPPITPRPPSRPPWHASSVPPPPGGPFAARFGGGPSSSGELPTRAHRPPRARRRRSSTFSTAGKGRG